MGDNACDDVFEWAARDPDRATFAAKADGAWQPVTAKQFADRVTAVAAGLIAAGIQPGDRIGLMSATARMITSSRARQSAWCPQAAQVFGLKPAPCAMTGRGLI